MRNFTNRERDKPLVVFVHPPVRPVFSSYEGRLIACNLILRSMLASTEHHLATARRALGWSE
jgi:hypothetical protein